MYKIIYIHEINTYFTKTSYPGTGAAEAQHSKFRNGVVPKDRHAVKFKNATCHGVQLLAKPRNTSSSQYFTLSKIKTNNNFLSYIAKAGKCSV